MAACCNVCCDPFTKKNKSVKCTYCEFDACITCVSRFIIESTIDPKCMNCKKPWVRKFLTDSFGKTFMSTKYKEKREKDLFDTEKALMPATQEYARRKKEIDAVNMEIYQLQNRLRVLKEHKKVLESNGVVFSKSSTKKTLSIKCPNDNCRGFVDSDTMECGTCDRKLCRECHEIITDDDGTEHACDPDTVQTVKLLKRDTKNCPKCNVGIHKIEGCDQMYCTQCHTAFSWRTGDIVIGERIHNPHYYEYLRTREGGGAAPPREMGDIPCGGIPRERDMYRYFNNTSIMGRLRLLIHIEREEFRNYATDRISDNLELRVKYINKIITEAHFKQSIQRRAKEIEKRREILSVLNTFVVAGSDIMRNLIVTRNADLCIQEFDALSEFMNASMRDISKIYNCVTPRIYNSTHILTRKD